MLSIPFWSDFISNPNVPYITTILAFQSHFGLILSNLNADLISALQEAFNPILVWFYQRSSKKARWRTKCPPFNPILVWFYPSFS